jgi:hypothetical protein
VPVQLRCAAAFGDLFRLYLTLPHSGAGSNFAQYTAGGASHGTTVVTTYSAIRIDPIPVRVRPLTFLANIADQTFATSTGLVCHSTTAPCAPSHQVTSMPYGVAADCAGPGGATGRANIDLRGTPFSVVNTFSIQGFEPGGTTAFSSSQVVNLTGGGFCGWNAPAPISNPFNTSPLQDARGGWDLMLTLPV